jgi:threonine synthase
MKILEGIVVKYKLKCTACNKEYSPENIEYTCPGCQGILRVDYDYEKLKSTLTKDVFAENPIKGHGRYIDLLPLEKHTSLPPLDIGPTPLDDVKRLRQHLSLNNLFIKNDTTLPTGSFKDRASSVLVAKAIELGKKIITTASTGNAATALAGMCASVGLKNKIFVPQTAPKAKLAQIAMFGGDLIPIKGTYDQAVSLCREATEKFGWYNRNTGYNPYTIEGKKTAALEIWEQLGYQIPDKLFIPTGDGVILSGTYKGFYDLKQIGLIDKIPAIIPVQAQGSAAIVRALLEDSEQVSPLNDVQTVADSIAVGAPACGDFALQIVRSTKGFGVMVSDDEIVAAIKELATFTGIFAEPAAATAYAGLKKAKQEGLVAKEESIVVLITGTGLKDVPTAMKAVSIPDAIEPNLQYIST